MMQSKLIKLIGLILVVNFIQAQQITRFELNLDTINTFSPAGNNHLLVSEQSSIFNIGEIKLVKIDHETGVILKSLSSSEVYDFVKKETEELNYEFLSDKQLKHLNIKPKVFVRFSNLLRIHENDFQCEITFPIQLDSMRTKAVIGLLRFNENLQMKDFTIRQQVNSKMTIYKDYGGFYRTRDTLYLIHELHSFKEDKNPYFTRFLLEDGIYNLDTNQFNIINRPNHINKFSTTNHTIFKNSGNICLTNGEIVVCSKDNLRSKFIEFQITKKSNECFSNIIPIRENLYIAGHTFLQKDGSSTSLELCLLDQNFSIIKTLYEYDVTLGYINSIEYLNGKLYLYMYHMKKNYLFLQTLDVSEFIKD